jgi:hypothetical protein
MIGVRVVLRSRNSTLSLLEEAFSLGEGNIVVGELSAGGNPLWTAGVGGAEVANRRLAFPGGEFDRWLRDGHAHSKDN